MKQFSVPGIGREEGIAMRCVLLLLSALVVPRSIPAEAAGLPPSRNAPAVGEKAPDFTLPDSDGSPVTLSRLYAAEGSAAESRVLLVFYRGYW